MTVPWVGESSDEYRAVCLYSLNPDTPPCDQPATVHILTESDKHGLVSLVSCDDHAPTARVSGRYVDEHVYGGVCGFPSTVWLFEPENRCALDDSGEEPVLCGVAVQEGEPT